MEPLFFQEDIDTGSGIITMDEPSSKHIVQVLRMVKGERIRITNGKGLHITAEIVDDHRKKTTARVLSSDVIEPATNKVSIAISPVKNTARFEWFLEKATEIGVSEIIPVICNRTEKTSLKKERLNGILVSAMIQSGQYWKPTLHDPARLQEFLKSANHSSKFIAHCENADNKIHPQSLSNTTSSNLILIGPEGDFTSEEIRAAIEHNFIPVSLGKTRLRTETAGMVAAALLVIPRGR